MKMEEVSYSGDSKNKLKKGYTTGSCAAAAAFAAATLLFQGEELENVFFRTPNNTPLTIKVESWEKGENRARCAVRKYSGDDPDVTDGMLVYACVSLGNQQAFLEDERLSSASFAASSVMSSIEGKRPLADVKPSLDEAEFPLPPGCRKLDGEWWYVEEIENGPILYLRGGEGIGRVTRTGLSCPVGMCAINPVPRTMIFEQTARVCREAGISGSVLITLEMPQGRKLAEKTFNARLGIVGGLSVLGTSGIVEPMSEPALLETIRLEIAQRAAEGERCLLLTPGNYGEHFLSEKLGIPLEMAVKCSNYIGDALDMAAEAGIEKLLLVGHAGKLIKLAAGVMNTHSRVADSRMECLAAYGAACGASREMVCKILECLTVEEALAVFEQENGLRERTAERIMKKISVHLRQRAGRKLQVEAIVFTGKWEIFGMTEGAQEMKTYFIRNKP